MKGKYHRISSLFQSHTNNNDCDLMFGGDWSLSSTTHGYSNKAVNKILMILLMILFSAYIIYKIPEFLTIYNKHKTLIENELWRQKECSDPSFFHRMQVLGSDICDESSHKRTENLMQPPLLVALHSCLPFRAEIHFLYWLLRMKHDSDPEQQSWFYTSFMLIFIVTLFVIYNIAIPFYYKMKERRDYLRCLEACSASTTPILEGHSNSVQELRKRRQPTKWNHHHATFFSSRL